MKTPLQKILLMIRFPTDRTSVICLEAGKINQAEQSNDKKFEASEDSRVLSCASVKICEICICPCIHPRASELENLR